VHKSNEGKIEEEWIGNLQAKATQFLKTKIHPGFCTGLYEYHISVSKNIINIETECGRIEVTVTQLCKVSERSTYESLCYLT